MKFNIINDVLQKRHTSAEKIATSLGMSSAGFRRSIKQESMKIAVFEKMCDEIKVHPIYFFLPNANIEQLPDFCDLKVTDLLPSNRVEILRLTTENSKLKDEIITLHKKLTRLHESK